MADQQDRPDEGLTSTPPCATAIPAGRHSVRPPPSRPAAPRRRGAAAATGQRAAGQGAEEGAAKKAAKKAPAKAAKKAAPAKKAAKKAAAKKAPAKKAPSRRPKLADTNGDLNSSSERSRGTSEIHGRHVRAILSPDQRRAVDRPRAVAAADRCGHRAGVLAILVVLLVRRRSDDD